MRALAVGLWKEWRDHRVVSVALLVALPVLVFAAAWAFGGEMAPADFGPAALFTLNVAQALYVLAVASESFGGERRRGTLDFLRRLPRGLGRAFTAKLAAYVLGSVLALLWGAVVAWTACRLLGPARATGDFAVLLLQPDPVVAILVGGLFVLGLWTHLTSNMIPHGGAAAVGAALLLGLLGVPVYLAVKDRPWLVRVPPPDLIRTALLILGSLGLVALFAAFLRGNRLLASAWAPAWRGLAVVGVVATGGYAWGAVALHRALTIDPRQDEFRIEQAFLGKGSRYLYLTVYRGPYAYQHEHSTGREAGTPHQPWIVDLNDGSWRIAGDFFQHWTPFAWNNVSVPQPIVSLPVPESKDVAWYDAETATVRKVLPFDVRTQEMHDWQQSVMPTLAWHHDEQGRALWLEGDRVVHEGEKVPLQKWIGDFGWGSYEAIPGGWSGHTVTWDKDHRNHEVTWFVADAGSGTILKPERVPNTVSTRLVLSPKTALRRAYTHPLSKRQHQRPDLDPWTLVDLETGAVTPTVNPPDCEHLARALPGERALLMVGPGKEPRTLSTWDPRTGATTPVLDESGLPFVGYACTVSAAAPGGVAIVCIHNNRVDPTGSSFALLDESAGTARRLPMNDSRWRMVCIEDADSVVAITPGSNSVVRLRYSTKWADGRHAFGLERLFPR